MNKKAKDLMNQKNYGEAILVFQNLPVLAPDDVFGMAHALLCFSDDSLSSINNALDFLLSHKDNIAKMTNSEFPSLFYYNLGTLYLKKLDVTFRRDYLADEAIKLRKLAYDSFSTALYMGLHRSRLYVQIAICLSQEGRHAAAFDAYSVAVKLDPENLGARTGLFEESMRTARLVDGKREAEILVGLLESYLDELIVNLPKGEKGSPKIEKSEYDRIAGYIDGLQEFEAELSGTEIIKRTKGLMTKCEELRRPA